MPESEANFFGFSPYKDLQQCFNIYLTKYRKILSYFCG